MSKFAALLLGAALSLPAQSMMNLRRAPGFSLPDVNQKQHDLADYRGRVVLIDIMQTKCPKCVETTRTLEGVKAKYGDKIQVLSVVTMPDTLKNVQDYIKTHKVTSPMLFDCGQMVASYLRITPANPTVHFPHIFVVDRNGMIRRELTHETISGTNVIGAIEAALK